MTKLVLDSIPAGRGMDALIAEKWMGWSRTVDGNNGWETVHRPDGTHAEYRDRVLGPIVHLDMAGMPEFSTSMAAAWTLVEKMKDSGVIISVNNSGTGDDPYCARWDRIDECFWRDCSWAATGPLAICRVALKAAAAREVHA